MAIPECQRGALAFLRSDSEKIAAVDDVALNWQQGATALHPLPTGTALEDWTITGVRAHADDNDHTGPFVAVQATFSVFINPFSPF